MSFGFMFRRLLFQSVRARPVSAHKSASRLRGTKFSTSIPRPEYQYIRFGTPKQPKNPYDFRTWDPRVQAGAALALGGGIYYVSHLEQVSETGRWRFMNTSPEAEAKFGELLRQNVREDLKHATLPPDHPLTRHVHRVVKRILHASNLGSIRGEEKPSAPSPFGLSTDAEGQSWNPDADVGAARDPGASYGPKKEWDVIVVHDTKIVNAMANPGLVVIFTGILPVCQDEEGLAAVLGHEIGHVVARHPAERMSSATLFLIAASVFTLFGLDSWISNMISKLVVELPNTRKQELEADLIGLRLMSRACYDPAAAPQMFSRLAKVEEKHQGHVQFDLLRTHPSSENRVKLLEERLSEGYSIMESNPDCVFVRGQFDNFKKSARALRITDSGLELA